MWQDKKVIHTIYILFQKYFVKFHTFLWKNAYARFYNTDVLIRNFNYYQLGRKRKIIILTKNRNLLQKKYLFGIVVLHSLIRGVLIQSCSAGAKHFTKCVFYYVQFSGVIQNIAYHRAIFTLFVYVDYYQNNQFY